MLAEVSVGWRSKSGLSSRILKLCIIASFIASICAPGIAVVSSKNFTNVVAEYLKDRSRLDEQIEVLRRSTGLWEWAVKVYNTTLYDFATSGNPHIGVIGDDGWMFLGDMHQDSFSQSIHRQVLAGDGLQNWVNTLDIQRRWLARHGIPLIFVVAPSQASIYPEKLPAWSKKWLSNASSLDRVIESGRDLPIVDVRPALREWRGRGNTYSRLNSHWTDFGAWVAWREIAERIKQIFPNFVAFGPDDLDGIETLPDYASEFKNLLNIEAPNPWERYVLSRPFPDFRFIDADGNSHSAVGATQTDIRDLPRRTINIQSANKLKAMVLRDSQGTALSPFLQASFLETIQLSHHWTQYPKDRINFTAAIEQYKPNLVIYIMTERYMEVPLGNYFYWYSLDAFDSISEDHEFVWTAGAPDQKDIKVAGDLTLSAGLSIVLNPDSAPKTQSVLKVTLNATGYGTAIAEYDLNGQRVRLGEEYWKGSNELYFNLPPKVDINRITLIKDLETSGAIALQGIVIRQRYQ